MVECIKGGVVSIVMLIFIFTNLALFVALFVAWQKIKKPPKEDPRLSRGLQLLQSKISVLEDLSDRTDQQVHQLIAILDQKTRAVQSKVQDAEIQIQKIEQSMRKSMEVADIFQDRIPHEEIIERQNSIKYIQAAQLAHQGRSVDEIAAIVDLPRGEVEFIAKVNKDQLMFDSEQLPAWAQQSLDRTTGESFKIENYSVNTRSDSFTPFEVPDGDLKALKDVGDKFRSAVRQHEEDLKLQQLEIERRSQPSEFVKVAKKMTQQFVDSAQDLIKEKTSGLKTREPSEESVFQEGAVTPSENKINLKKALSQTSEFLQNKKTSGSKIIKSEEIKGNSKDKFVITRDIGIKNAEFPILTTNNKNES